MSTCNCRPTVYTVVHYTCLLLAVEKNSVVSSVDALAANALASLTLEDHGSEEEEEERPQELPDHACR